MSSLSSSAPWWPPSPCMSSSHRRLPPTSPPTASCEGRLGFGGHGQDVRRVLPRPGLPLCGLATPGDGRGSLRHLPARADDLRPHRRLQRGCPDDALAPVFIGLTVTSIIALIAPLTQAGLNPARDLGPRLVAWLAGWERRLPRSGRRLLLRVCVGPADRRGRGGHVLPSPARAVDAIAGSPLRLRRRVIPSVLLEVQTGRSMQELLPCRAADAGNGGSPHSRGGEIVAGLARLVKLWTRPTPDEFLVPRNLDELGEESGRPGQCEHYWTLMAAR